MLTNNNKMTLQPVLIPAHHLPMFWHSWTLKVPFGIVPLPQSGVLSCRGTQGLRYFGYMGDIWLRSEQK